MVDEQRNVLAPLAQRRHLDAQHVEPVEEVLAEAAGADLGLEFARGRGDHAHVDAARLRFAERAHFLLLEDAQQLDLERQRQLADLVEEERAAVGLDEEAAPRAVGAGEGALGVPEELALEQRLGNRAAVHRDEGLAAARRLRRGSRARALPCPFRSRR